MVQPCANFIHRRHPGKNAVGFGRDLAKNGVLKHRQKLFKIAESYCLDDFSWLQRQSLETFDVEAPLSFHQKEVLAQALVYDRAADVHPLVRSAVFAVLRKTAQRRDRFVHWVTDFRLFDDEVLRQRGKDLDGDQLPECGIERGRRGAADADVSSDQGLEFDRIWNAGKDVQPIASR